MPGPTTRTLDGRAPQGAMLVPCDCPNSYRTTTIAAPTQPCAGTTGPGLTPTQTRSPEHASTPGTAPAPGMPTATALPLMTSWQSRSCRVNVSAPAAILLLDSRSDRFSELLQELGEDRDLVEEREPWSDDWSGWLLWKELMRLPGVGATTASKLLARKRPRLRPIYDSVVAEVIGSTQLWEPLRSLLNSDPALHERLLRLRRDAGLFEAVSALRVFDVVTWMEGKYGTA